MAHNDDDDSTEEAEVQSPTWGLQLALSSSDNYTVLLWGSPIVVVTELSMMPRKVRRCDGDATLPQLMAKFR